MLAVMNFGKSAYYWLVRQLVWIGPAVAEPVVVDEKSVSRRRIRLD